MLLQEWWIFFSITFGASCFVVASIPFCMDGTHSWWRGEPILVSTAWLAFGTSVNKHLEGVKESTHEDSPAHVQQPLHVKKLNEQMHLCCFWLPKAVYLCHHSCQVGSLWAGAYIGVYCKNCSWAFLTGCQATTNQTMSAHTLNAVCHKHAPFCYRCISHRMHLKPYGQESLFNCDEYQLLMYRLW